MSKFIDLKESKKPTWRAPNHTIKSIKKSLPLIESPRGHYSHRVRFVDMHTNSDKKSWFSVKVWCGMSFNTGGTRGETYFISIDQLDRPICATCEGRFIGAGLDGDRVINGRKVMYREF